MKPGRECYFKGMNLRQSSKADQDSTNEGKCVILDVGGDRFVASRKHLERFPATRYILFSGYINIQFVKQSPSG